ncbi:MAG: hypothetical protein K6F97_12390 [Lachnospiraceae bacterium]|nr:hypothetical protein [Lachnospiraceae bacterium]
MRRVFFVDYENVDTNGLDGLSRLTSQDQIYIYYSEAHSRMSFGLHRRICESKSEFIYRKIKDKSKNALDNELMREAENVICDKKTDYYIISDDKGYSSFVKKKVVSGFKVDQYPTISETNKKKKDDLKKTINARLVSDKKQSYELDENEIERIASMIMNAEDKSELNRSLQKMFDNEDVKYIFSRLKDITYNM